MPTGNSYGIEARLNDLISRNFKNMEAVVRGSTGRMNAALNKTESASRRTDTASSKLGASVKGLAVKLGLTAAAVGGMYAAVRKANRALEMSKEVTIEYEKSLSRIKAIVQPTQKEFAALAAKARELGNETVFTASQSAEAFKEMGKLGKNTNEIIKMSAQVLNMAAVAEVELSDASKTTVQTLNQFQMQASESNRAVDVMGASFNQSALDFEKYTEAMRYVGTTARQVDLDLETTTALLSVLADNSVEASSAGTSLNMALAQLAKPSSKVNKLMDDMGLKNADVLTKMNALATSGIDVGEAFDLLDIRASRAMNIIMQNTDKVKDLTESYRHAEGTAQKMADTMLDNVAGATVKLKSAQQGLAIAFGESFGKGRKKAIEDITDEVRRMTEITEGLHEPISRVGQSWNMFLSRAKITMMRNLNGLIVEFLHLTTDVEQNDAWKTDKEKLEALKLILSEVVERGKKIEEVKEQWKDYGGLINSIREGMEIGEINKQYGDLGAAVKEINLIMGEGTVTATDNFKTLQEEVDQYIKKLEKAGRTSPPPGFDVRAGGKLKPPTPKSPPTDDPGGGIGLDSESEEGGLEIRKSLLNKYLRERNEKIMEAERERYQVQYSIMAAMNELQADSRGKELEAVRIHYENLHEANKKGLDGTKKLNAQERAAIFKVNKKWDDKEEKEKDKRNKKEKDFAKAVKEAQNDIADSLVSAADRMLTANVKSAKSRKHIALLMSVVEGALAVQRALVFPPGPPATIPSAIATGVKADANTAMIAATPLQKGGIVDRPMLALMGEAGAEGVLNAAATARLGVGTINALNTGQRINNHVTNQIVFSPSVQVVGSEDRGSVIDALDSVKPQFADWIEKEVIGKGYLNVRN